MNRICNVFVKNIITRNRQPDFLLTRTGLTSYWRKIKSIIYLINNASRARMSCHPLFKLPFMKVNFCRESVTPFSPALPLQSDFRTWMKPYNPKSHSSEHMRNSRVLRHSWIQKTFCHPPNGAGACFIYFPFFFPVSGSFYLSFANQVSLAKNKVQRCIAVSWWMTKHSIWTSACIILTCNLYVTLK